MAVLEDKQKDQLKKLFESLDKPVKLTVFKKDEKECDFCQITHDLIEEVASTSDKISLTAVEFSPDSEEAKKYGIDKTPAIVVEGDKDYGIRFYGVPSGYEFTPLIEDILSVSIDHHGLEKEVLDELAKIDKPVHIQVLTSPTCPYCPMAVRAAHRLAMASDKIKADMIESAEYPDLIEKYEVQGVPHTVINDFYNFVGPIPELELAYEILRSMGKPAPPRPVHVHDHEHEHDHDHEHVHEHAHGKDNGGNGSGKVSELNAKKEQEEILKNKRSKKSKKKK